MMQQMTLQQQAFMQTMTASFQQQQQSLLQSMEASMQHQQQLLRQQFSNVVPVPPEALGPPGLATYRISTQSGKVTTTTSTKRPLGWRKRCLC